MHYLEVPNGKGFKNSCTNKQIITNQENFSGDFTNEDEEIHRKKRKPKIKSQLLEIKVHRKKLKNIHSHVKIKKGACETFQFTSETQPKYIQTVRHNLNLFFSTRFIKTAVDFNNAKWPFDQSQRRKLIARKSEL